MKITKALLVSSLIAIVVFIGCKQDTDDKPYDIETAKMVSTVTAGLLAPDQSVQVTFVADMVREAQVDQNLKKTVFDFNPSIEGNALWQDRRTLIFKPNNDLPFRETYSGVLDLNALFPEHKDKDLELLSINFQVAGREIASFNGELILKNGNDPKYLIYQGQINFTEATSLEIVKDAAELQLNNRTRFLEWSASEDKKQYHFKTAPFERTKRQKKLSFKIDKSDLELSYDFTKSTTIPALSDLKVTDIIRGESGTQPDLKIEFSDELKSEQDIRGFVSFEPEIEVQLKILGKSILVQAPFDFGQSYILKVRAGVRSRWATKLKHDFSEEILFEDMLPGMKFAKDGVFLPSSNQKKITFMTANVRRVQLRVLKVFESNLGQFLQMEKLDGNAQRRDQFNYQIDRVGIEVANQPLQIGETKNKWLQHEIDLSKLIKSEETGLFLVEITFRQQDMIYNISVDNLQYSRRRGRDYYNDPASQGYLWYHGRIFKPVICTDIGLVYKKGEKQHSIYTTNLITAQPLAGVQIRLMTYQNQILTEGFTDNNGMLSFDNIDQNVFYVEAEKDGQRSVIKPNEMAWNLSTFETGGEMVKGEGVRAFIYADRGVHRPGDKIYLSAIIRNENNTFPKDHPVTLEVTNPKNQTVYTETKRSAADGYYSFQFSTKDNDLTGNYMVLLTAGSKKFRYTLRIETIVPERLKVKIETNKPNLVYSDKEINVNLNSTYLFGNPAAGLQAEISISLSSINKTFKKYSDYIFTNQTATYQTSTSYIFKNPLNAQGNAKVRWSLPSLRGVPSAINALIKAEVWEKGGRSSKDQLSVNIDPYPYYIGIKSPELKYWYAQTGMDYQIPVIVLSPEGTEAAGRTVQYKVYRNEYTWWWEYDSREQYRLRFKNAKNTEFVDEGSVISGATPTLITFHPEERGQYLIEVRDGNDGHVAAFFISAYPWGETPSSGKDAGILAIKTDKEKYNPGEQALVSFPVPQKASILFTVEKGNKVIESQWYDTDGKETEKNIKINISDKMLPTVYASVSVFQPHSQTANDRPIRMYGVVPINVEHAATHHKLKINMPDELMPEREFEVEVQTSDKKQTQLTIAVVDEGLLSLTRFKTPDAWKAFFKKQGLGVLSYDLFNHVIGANKGDIFSSFSIGGGVDKAKEYLEGQLDQQKAKRFKAVVMFEGPIMTNSDGKAKVKFVMPNYIGAVRVMVVSATGNRYGKAEKTVPVKSDLMVLPTLPRVIGPKDKIKVPVTVFAMKENLGEVKVQLKLDGPLQAVGEALKIIQFTKTGEKDVLFEIKAKPAVGVAKIKIEAKSVIMNTKYETEISIRSSAPRITESIDQIVDPGQTVSLVIPDKGLAGSNQATISIQRRPNLKLTRRILWLIRYPYGCIEQTVSSVFPQLYLMEFLPKSRDAKRDIDKNINAAIDRLRKFQLSSGGFTYWPGSNYESDWGTSYAGHFLIEAQKLGYNVPEDMIKNWLRYQKSNANKNDKYIMMQVYRNYTLSLAGESSFSGMNILLENQLNNMTDVQKWLLAAGYKMSGAGSAADRVLNSAGTSVEEYLEFGDTYGSTLRDKSIILEQLIIFERWKEAATLANEIATVISSNNWYSTQTTAFMLMALGKYFKAIEGDEKPLLVGTINLPDGSEIPFETGDINFQTEIESGFGKRLQVKLDKESTVKHAYVNLEWSGLPLEYFGETKDHNLTLFVEWLDEDGMKINPANITQGQTFWAHFSVAKMPAYRAKIEEIALVQVLPAGWEIDNTRLSGESMPHWTRGWRLNREEYLDIRDDRVMWFFDLNVHGRDIDFLVKLNAVTVGEFVLPPTLLEAMYNNNYRSTKAGKRVTVTGR
jgi:uncharacterized protein YfaS (alpha-2-macroglobulin family)